MSPKKVRLVADAVRGAAVERALATLRFMNKKATTPIAKAIESATANAVHNFELTRENLFVKELRVDDAPTIKRWMPRAHGRATPIRKRNSHITVIVAEIKDSGKKSGKRSAVDAPVKIGEMGGAHQESKAENQESEAPEDRLPGARGKKTADGSRSKGFASKMFRRKAG